MRRVIGVGVLALSTALLAGSMQTERSLAGPLGEAPVAAAPVPADPTATRTSAATGTMHPAVWRQYTWQPWAPSTSRPRWRQGQGYAERDHGYRWRRPYDRDNRYANRWPPREHRWYTPRPYAGPQQWRADPRWSWQGDRRWVGTSPPYRGYY